MKEKMFIWLFTLLCLSCSRVEQKDKTSVINLIVNDNETKSASVTGKELLWSRLQIKRKSKLGSIRFNANVNRADMIQIRASNSYSYFNCYIEENQELNVVYENHQYFVTGDNIAARQNQLLIDIENVRRNTLSCIVGLPSDTTYHDLYLAVEKMITNFTARNKDASSDFLQFARFDNRYFYLRQAEQAAVLAAGDDTVFSAERLEILRNTLVDSNYELAYLSSNYRLMLKEYLDYERANDSGYLSKTTINPIENERILASELKSDELRAFQMATSIKQLLQVDCRLNLQYEIQNNTGYWKQYLQDEYREFLDRGIARIESKNGNYNHLSTSFLSNILDSVSMTKWKYLEIDNNVSGNPADEKAYLEAFCKRIPGLVCICVVTNPLFSSEFHDSTFSRSYIPKSELSKCLKSDDLPYSLLINPQGQVIVVNLPEPSTGMLLPMLLKLI